MSTLKELVYNILDLHYEGIVPDDSRINKRQVKKWIADERAYLIRQEISKHRKIPKQLTQDLGCLKLECVDAVECCELGVATGNHIWRTPELPDFLFVYNQENGSQLTIDFFGLPDGISPIEFTHHSSAYWSRYKKYTPKQRRAFYKNRRIYVTNAGDLKYVNMRAILQDPEEIANVVDPCSGNYCFSEESRYPILPHQETMLIRMINERYIKTMAQPYNQADVDNNANENPEVEGQQ